jgi:hypothetical protein
VLCIIDDAHWLDDASASALGFVARRVEADRIALLFAARDGDVQPFYAPGLPELHLDGLDAQAGGELLAELVDVPIPPEVASRLIEATGGNPLALVELPSLITPGQLAGREPLPWPLPTGHAVQCSFSERVRRLPEDTQRLLLAAAADETSRLATVLAAAIELGLPADALDPAERAELILIESGQLEFPHPLLRSAIYQAGTDAERREAHRALGNVLVGQDDSDRRAWHLALAAVGPDESVVQQLEQTAGRAQGRSGFEAACRALQRAAELTAEPALRASRLARAGQYAWLAVQPVRAAGLLQEARLLTTDPIMNAHVDMLRAWIELSIGSTMMARRLLVDAAKAIVDIDPPHAGLRGRPRACNRGSQARCRSAHRRIDNKLTCQSTGGQHDHDPNSRPAAPHLRQLDDERTGQRAGSRAYRHRTTPVDPSAVRARRPTVSSAGSLPCLSAAK